MLNWARIILVLVIALQPVVLSGAPGDDAAMAMSQADCPECKSDCSDCDKDAPCGESGACTLAQCPPSPAFLSPEAYFITSAGEALKASEPLACVLPGIPPILLRPPIYA